MVNDSGCVVQCYGMTKEPETNNFIMVMHYAPNGSLRQNLNNNFNKLSWIDKLNNLREIAGGLAVIHDKGLIHHDFHCGNILSWHTRYTYITDLGLCKPANEKAKKLETLFQDLWYSRKQENSTIYKQIFEASEINKNLSSSLTGTLPYATHPQAVYTSRLLDYKNLPEPKNNDNDDSFEIMYSG